MEEIAEMKTDMVRQTVMEARQQLSDLNLSLAQFRVAKGMSVKLSVLYRAMGKADGVLVEAEEACRLSQTVYEVGGLWDYLNETSE